MRPVLIRWLVSFAGVALLGALVWLFGPLLPELEDDLPRLGIIGALGVAWVVANLLLDGRRRGRERRLMAGVTASAASGDTAAQEEASALAAKLATALASLKKARGTRGYLYEQPWYAIIGPPGAGKTTALLNAGLTFPLAGAMGQGAVAGVGGTRLCDWWFTETAVLIDTAGRYTTQDSDAGVDRAGWDAFLTLLKTTRPRQPLNGVIVAIALSDIAQAPPAERHAHAQAIRRRVKELETRLGMRMPVYALFTKVDLIAGFTEFFGDLDRTQRDQVWGATFPMEKSSPASFPDEFRLLLARLDDRLFARLHTEEAVDRRGLIAGFPAQVASLEQPLTAFLSEAFGPEGGDLPLLRGAYFVSGTQEGTPIDRLLGAMSRAFGVDQRRAVSLRPERGRSYFLGRLLREVIFGEAMLVSQPPAARRRARVLRIGAFAAVALAAVLASGFLLVRSQIEQREVTAAAGALAEYTQTAAALPLDPVSDSDLPSLLPLLDVARALPHGYEPAASGGGFDFGLSQDGKLGAAARAVYRHGLDNALLPRLIWRLESQMRGNISRPDFLYEATRIYLMLGGAGPLDRELVRQWMSLDWQVTYSGAFNAPLVQSLGRHLDALLAAPLPAVTLDGALVTQARATFSRVPLAARLYSRIKPSAAAQRVPPWTPAEPLGPAGLRVFVRASGKPMTEGIPGFFTVDGFHAVLLPGLVTAGKEVAAESWVLGQRPEATAGAAALRTLEQQVVTLYEADYTAAWDAMLTDLNVAPLRSLPQAAQDLYILAAAQSPMRALLASAARELTLSAPPTGIAAAAGAQAAAATSSSAARVSAVLASAASEAPVLPPGHEVDERYKALRDLMGGGGQIEQATKALGDLQQQLAKLAALPPGAPLPAAVLTGNDPAAMMRTEASRQPQPLARWLTAVASSGAVLRGGGARQQVVAAYSSAAGPGPACPLVVNGRFPFAPTATLDAPLDDFAKLFAPGGLVDGFVNTQLRPYVDMSAKVWKPQAADGVPAPVSPADLGDFQRAVAIRDTFFVAGGASPTVRFDIMPTTLDAGATQVTLDFDGTPVTNTHAPARATQITWPGPSRMQNVRLVFEPPQAGGTGVVAETGPWALFRLFGHGKLTPGATPGKYTLTFQLGDRAAAFELNAGSALNPFAPGVLPNFHCPAVQ